MKLKYVDRVLSVLVVLVWMAVIFSFSAKTASSSSAMSGGIIEKVVSLVDTDFKTLPEAEQVKVIESWQFIVRKAAHMWEYALLGLLASNMLRSFSIKGVKGLLVSPVICLVYAVSDEIHQHFVSGRACRLLDVTIDFVGAICGATVFFAAAWLINSLMKRKKIDDKKTDA